MKTGQIRNFPIDNAKTCMFVWSKHFTEESFCVKNQRRSSHAPSQHVLGFRNIDKFSIEIHTFQ